MKSELSQSKIICVLIAATAGCFAGAILRLLAFLKFDFDLPNVRLIAGRVNVGRDIFDDQ
jgi:hypothetical protein